MCAQAALREMRAPGGGLRESMEAAPASQASGRGYSQPQYMCSPRSRGEGNSLGVQCLGLGAFTVVGLGLDLIPG